MLTLEQIIRQHVHLPHVNNKGWWPVLCKVCNDRGHKGKRAAFLFENNNVAYHCFNCGHTAAFNPQEHKTISDKMSNVLDAFGIDRDEWKPIEFNQLGKYFETTKRTETQEIEPATIELPEEFYKLGTRGDKWDIIATSYLEDRQIDPSLHEFYLSDKSNAKWYGRLIMPVYKDQRLIFFQGRDLTKLQPKKYLSVDVPKDNVLYGFEKLFDHQGDKLFIVEGMFDAMSIGGVATIGNEMTSAQIKWLNKSPKTKIIIPDRFGNGHLLIKPALEHDNWAVSTPFINGWTKDMNDAVVEYGKIYTLKQIIDNITTNKFEIDLKTKLYCKGTTEHGKRRV